MKLRKLVLSSLLLAIGLILHQIVPPIFMGMKPDFLLSMMFIAIFLGDDYKLALIVGAAAGIFTALTTTFPGGQAANIIDKLITCNFVFLLYKLTKNKLNYQVQMGIIALLGTLVSGFVFLGTALLIAGLPAPFSALVLTVVVPAAVVNTAASLILYNAVFLALKRTSY
jgi:hypothetical protein